MSKPNRAPSALSSPVAPPVAPLSRATSLLCATALLCAAAFINGGPILFPDTLSYLSDGANLVRLSHPINERSVFYGLLTWPLHWERTLWPVVLAQGLVVAHLLWLALRALGVQAGAPTFVAIAAALALGTPLSWHASHVLPDVFAGAGVLALFLLGFVGHRLRHGEIAYLVLLAAAAVSFHLSHLPTALAVAGATVLAWAVGRWRRGPRAGARDAHVRPNPFLVLAPIALAIAGLLAFSMVVHGFASLTPKSPPFVVARLLANGTAKAWLREVCPRRPLALCPHIDTIPDNEIAIVWGFFYERRRTPEYARMRAEQGEVVVGTVLRFPREVIGNALSATGWQLVTIESEAQFNDADRWKLPARYPYAAAAFEGSLQDRGLLSKPSLAQVNRLHGWVAALSALAVVVLAALCARRGRWLPVALAAVVALALLANAFTTGALSGVYGRYQGRMIWLLTFCAFVAGWHAAAAGRAARPDQRSNAIRPPTSVARTRPTSSRPA